MKTLHIDTSRAATQHAAILPMRELISQECEAVSGGMPAMILLGVGIAAFGIGVVADNHFNGPMADWWYRVSR